VENIAYNGRAPSRHCCRDRACRHHCVAAGASHIRSGLCAPGHYREKRWFDLPDVPTMQDAATRFVSETFQACMPGRNTTPSYTVARDTLESGDPPPGEAACIGFDCGARRKPGDRVARVPMWRDVIVQSRIEVQ